jgi:hypothetical protein
MREFSTLLLNESLVRAPLLLPSIRPWHRQMPNGVVAARCSLRMNVQPFCRTKRLVLNRPKSWRWQCSASLGKLQARALALHMWPCPPSTVLCTRARSSGSQAVHQLTFGGNRILVLSSFMHSFFLPPTTSRTWWTDSPRYTGPLLPSYHHITLCTARREPFAAESGLPSLKNSSIFVGLSEGVE